MPATATDVSLQIVAAARPHPSERINGDAWSASWDGDHCRILVVDGLGHGPEAAAASSAAVHAVESAAGFDPAALLRHCHDALGGMRGAAASIAVVNTQTGQLSYAGVGNVEAHLWQAEAPHRVAHPISYRGIVGSTMPRGRTFGFRLTGEWRLLLHTDGISARFDLASLAPSDTASGPDALQTLADAVLAGWGENTDDATVVIVSPAAHTYALDARTPAGLPG